MKFIFILFSAVIFSHNVFSQNSQSQARINSFDSKGKKNGFWSEKDNDIKIERYYVNGIKNGIEKAYYRNGTLMSFLEYKDGHIKGVGYFFHEEGYLIFTIKYIAMVTYKSQKLQKGYFTIYNPVGSIKESGIGLFKEGDEELGEEIRIGKW
ncbi:MAG: hypothetical protein JWQ09_4500 [Segetibacter sp.]|nr:hypothetical protein [Segetibacter sp.]